MVSEAIFGIKIYVLMFIGLFLVGVAINQTTKKEYRQPLKQVWGEHLRIFGSMTLVAAVMLVIAWFMFGLI